MLDGHPPREISMSDSVPSDDACAKEKAGNRGPEHDLEVWKYFAGMGGTDKNTMITTVSWHLAFAAAAIWYIVTDSQMIAPTFPSIHHPGRMMVVSLLGVLVSVVAWFLAILYAGYSNRNWAMADEVARRHQWLDLVPEGAAGEMKPEQGGKPERLAARAWKWGRPCYPQTELAPVFKVYSRLALGSGLAHTFFFLWSFYFLLIRVAGAS
jgi:hypothetical protein